MKKRKAHPSGCECEYDHGCHDCPCCGTIEHRFTDEPYCDDCGKPHPGYFGALREMLMPRRKRGKR